MRELIAMPALFSAFVGNLGLLGVRALNFHDVQPNPKTFVVMDELGGYSENSPKLIRGFGGIPHGCSADGVYGDFRNIIQGVPTLRVRPSHGDNFRPARARNQAPEVPVLPRKAPIERKAA